LRGDLGIWDAVWCGLVGWIAAEIVLRGNNSAPAIWLGTVAGSISLTLQAFSWALVRNPLAVAAGYEPPDEDLEDLDDHHVGAQRLVEDEPAVVVAGVLVGGSKSRDDSYKKPIPPQHIRSKALRVVAAVLALIAANGIIALSVPLGMGEFRCCDDKMGAIIGIVAMSLFFLFWLGTVRRVKRVGAWSEWVNPILRVLVGTALATGISGMALTNVKGGDFGGFVVLTVFASTVLLALLLSRRSRRAQLRRYHQQQEASYYGPASADSGSRSPIEDLEIHAQIDPSQCADACCAPPAGGFVIPARHGAPTPPAQRRPAQLLTILACMVAVVIALRAMPLGGIQVGGPSSGVPLGQVLQYVAAGVCAVIALRYWSRGGGPRQL